MKYSSIQRQTPRKSNEPHPIWRGIGCLIMIIIPVISFALSILAVDAAGKRGIVLPAGLTGYPVMPDFLFVIPGLVGLLNWIQSQYNLYAYLLVALFFIVVLGAIVAVVYAYMYRISAPSHYTGVDAPPPSVRTKRYKR